MFLRILVFLFLLLPLYGEVIYHKTYSYFDRCNNTWRSGSYYCERCEETDKLTPSNRSEESGPTATCDITDSGGSGVNSLSGSYQSKVNENAPEGSSGCGPCGSSSKSSPAWQYNLVRYYSSRRSHRVWDMGLGQASSADFRLSLFEESNGSLTIYQEAPQLDFAPMYVDGRGGDQRDGVFHSYYGSEVELHLLDANDNLVLNFADAVKIRYIDFKFKTYEYEVIHMGGSDYAGRLVSVKDLNGYGVDITYKNFTQAQITADPSLQWQKDTVTDSTNRVTSFNYHSTSLGGEYVLSSVVLPNGSNIQYEYTDTYLSKVTYPDGSFTSHSYSVDSDGDTVYHQEETDGRVKDIYMSSSATLVSRKSGQILYNQNSMATGTVRVNGEITFAYYQHPTLGNQSLIYTGENQLKERDLDRYARYYKSFTVTPEPNGDIMHSGLQGTQESKYVNRQIFGTPMGIEYPDSISDSNGVTCNYHYDERGNTVFKSYQDDTFEFWTYNSLNKVTRYRDREGRVTLSTYDSRGNLLTREVGLLDTYTGFASNYNHKYWRSGNLTQIAGVSTSQSSTLYGAGASRAIDGNSNGQFNMSSVTHTSSELNAWWKASLVRSSLINEVKLYNRKESPERLADFTVKLFDGGVEVYSETFLNQVASEGIVTVIPPVGTYADSVQVQLNGTNYLSLAEVEVYGVDAVVDAEEPIADNATSSYAIYTKEYYPAGHANQHLLRYDFDANNNRTEYLYDSNNRLIQINEPDDTGSGYHAKASFTYNGSGLLATSTDAVGRVTSFEYDLRERLVKTTYNDTSTELNIYGTGTQSGLIVKRKDRNGNVSKTEYDGAARVSKRISAYSTMNADGSGEVVNPASVQSVTEYTYLNGQNVPSVVIVNGDRSEYTYDYRLRRIESRRFADANSVLVSSQEYLENKLFKSTDPYGRRTYYKYRDSDGALKRTIQETVPGTLNLSTYSAVKNQSRDLSNNANYLINDFVLDKEQQQIAVVDGRDIRHETDYDSRGRTTFQIRDVGGLNQTSQTLYDANSNVVEVRNPRYFSESIDDRSSFTYTRRNLRASRTVATGSSLAATEYFTYYNDGRAQDHTDFRSNTSTSIWHQCCGRFQAGVDRDGHVSVSNNDYYSNVTHTAVVDKNGVISDYHDLPNTETVQEVTVRYDERNRPVARTVWLDALDYVDPNNVPIFGEAGAPAGKSGLTSYTYYYDEVTGHPELTPLLTELAADGISFDANNDGSAVISLSPAGEVSASIQDGLGRTVISGVYDKDDWALGTYTLVSWSTVVNDTVVNGLLETKTVSALNHENKVHSDGAGRRIKSIDAEGKESTFEYDANSNLVSFRDANGVGQDCAFDNLNRDTSCTDTNGGAVTKAYDLNNNLVSQTDAKGNNTVCTFDERNRRVDCTDRIAGLTSYTYDANSNVKTITDALGKVTSYDYNLRNQQIKVTYADHIAGSNPGDSTYGITECSFDALGRRDVCTDQNGDTVTSIYDLAGRLSSREYHLAGATLDSTDTFTYDEASRILTASKGRYNNTVSFTYDAIGRKKTETLTLGGSSYTTSCDYDADNRVVSCTYPSGNVLAKSWTDRNQLATVTFDNQAIIASTYDNGGREQTRTFGNGLVKTMTYNLDNTKDAISVAGKADLSFAYAYDANKNVTAETSTGTVMDDYSFSAGFDDQDRVTQWDRSNLDTQSWTLDKIGNWQSTAGSLGSGAFNETRTHNDTHQLTAIGAQSVSYDAKGNMTSDAYGNTLLWDIDNHLESFEDVTFTYDALGRRVEKSTASLATLYISHGQRVIEEYEAAAGQAYSLARSYTHGSYVDDLLAKVERGAEVYEAEAASLNGPIIETGHAYLPNGSYVDYNLTSNESVTWTFHALSSSTYDLDFRYALGAAARDMELYVDGVYETTLTFTSTGTWADWSDLVYAKTLSAGTHTLELRSVGPNGGPNVDYLKVQNQAEETHFYHSDRQFNVRGLTDASGNTLELYAYSTYGKRTILDQLGVVLTVSSYSNNYGFTGRYLDEEIGLWYFRARYFNDEMGRFISRDPLGYVDGMSLYNGYFAEEFGLDPSGTEVNTLTKYYSRFKGESWSRRFRLLSYELYLHTLTVSIDDSNCEELSYDCCNGYAIVNIKLSSLRSKIIGSHLAPEIQYSGLIIPDMNMQSDWLPIEVERYWGNPSSVDYYFPGRYYPSKYNDKTKEYEVKESAFLIPCNKDFKETVYYGHLVDENKNTVGKRVKPILPYHSYKIPIELVNVGCGAFNIDFDMTFMQKTNVFLDRGLRPLDGPNDPTRPPRTRRR